VDTFQANEGIRISVFFSGEYIKEKFKELMGEMVFRAVK